MLFPKQAGRSVGGGHCDVTRDTDRRTPVRAVDLNRPIHQDLRNARVSKRVPQLQSSSRCDSSIELGPATSARQAQQYDKQIYVVHVYMAKYGVE